MGEIITSKVFGDKVIYNIVLNEEESLSLKGGIKNIHMFSLEQCDSDSKIMARGKDKSAKYFLIPIKYKLKSRKKLRIISIQVIETETKAIYIYICEKSKSPIIL